MAFSLARRCHESRAFLETAVADLTCAVESWPQQLPIYVECLDVRKAAKRGLDSIICLIGEDGKLCERALSLRLEDAKERLRQRKPLEICERLNSLKKHLCVNFAAPKPQILDQSLLKRPVFLRIRITPESLGTKGRQQSH